MPLYEYRCDSCDDTVEVLQKFSDEPLKICGKCGGRLERLISPPGLQFKGSGWYITDYARAGKSDNGGQSDKAAPKSETKSDSKSAEKSGAKTTPAASSSKGDKA
jgi:putative FmdB family regulatory protein